MIEMFTDRNPMRLGEFKLPADGIRVHCPPVEPRHVTVVGTVERACPSSLHDSDGGAHDADRPD